MDKKRDYIVKLSHGWTAAGVEAGDVLLVHSDIRRTLLEAKKLGVYLLPNDILDSFLFALGPSGTLLVPTFNFDFPKSKSFDIRHTPSQMGALTEAARNRHDAVRTGHPIYSFVALGNHRDKFYNVNNESGYGKDSPFGILHKLGGKIASLDLEDQVSMTFYHYVEESLKVNYRYFKDFTGEYTDNIGISSERTYKLFVRNIEKNVVTNVNPAGELMWCRGIYRGFKPKVEIGLRTVNAANMFDFVADLINRDEAEGFLFRFDN
jgi:aminoglycoside 3-N-acetyltransferase